MAGRLLGALPLLLAASALSAAGPTIRIPPGPEPSAAFRDAVSRVRAAGGGTIEFAAGDYAFDPVAATDMRFYISNHDQRDVHRVHLPLVGVTNLTLRGNGARLFFRGDVIPLVLLDTRDVRVEGLSIDWKKPFVFEARIVGFRRGQTLTDRQPDFEPARAMLFRGETHEVVERTGTMPPWHGHQRAGAQIGDVVAMRPGERPAPAIVVYRAVRSTFEDVVVHACHGMAWIVQRAEDFTLRGRGRAQDRTCGVFPSDGRIVSADADATHFSNVKGTVVVENCCFEGMMDDAINVHSTCLAIQEVCAPDSVRCRYMHDQAIGFETFRPGETLRLIRGRTLENGPEMKVTGVRREDERTVVLALDRPLPPGYGVGDAVENADYQPAVVFRGNIVARNRARGALFTTPRRIVCEGNLFDHVSGAAILFAGDAQGWYESGACRDVVVTNNVFRNCLTSRHKFGFAEAVISIYPSVRELHAQRTRYHRGIRIVGNTFETFDVPLLFAVSAEDVSFRGNRIVRNNDYRGWCAGDFLLGETAQVDIAPQLGSSGKTQKGIP